ncbi:TetR/AcrR family transcriptional regulator [Pseudonocardia kongjuensis]|uniref:TetR/AcrR family transcriptional regulator n=1 Tax=Pseudonocardia kongjuensis TaxID=102227 RepID=A0ABN1XTT8_9PSEU
MARARTPRTAWIDAGLAVLAARGPDAVRVEALAQQLGVTKGGFYGYFDDRPALLAEMLDTWERRSIGDVLDRVEREGGDTRTRARRAGELTFSPELLTLDLAVRDWARRDAAVAERLRRVDDQRLGFLRTQFADRFPDPVELEARCLLAFCTAIASDLILARHPGNTRGEIVDRAEALLFGGD